MTDPNSFEGKIAVFAALLEADQLRGLIQNKLDCQANRDQHKVRVIDGKKYVKVDVGSSGRFMVVKETGEIFGIKAYGVIHRGHRYGTLNTIEEWDWSGYYAHHRGTVRPAPKMTVTKETL